MMIIKRKVFTIYDDTDNLKRMKDSDILAEKKKKNPVSLGTVAGTAAAGALAGGAAGSVIGGFTKNRVAGSSFLSKMGRGGKKGLIYGGLLAGGAAVLNRSKHSKDNQFYNERLEYAQRQAKRRERKDWKANMTQREGYSF